jgi:fluoride exporter
MRPAQRRYPMERHHLATCAHRWQCPAGSVRLAVYGWQSPPGAARLGRKEARMGAWVAVAVGGAIGSVARFWLTGAMTTLTGPRFPWGTLLINVVGSMVIGLVAGIALTSARVSMHPDIRIFLMTGVCGGFTTFSAFSLQTLEMMQGGDAVPALGYALGSVVLCVAATFGGWALGRL